MLTLFLHQNPQALTLSIRLHRQPPHDVAPKRLEEEV
jgi:hypothetical protein